MKLSALIFTITAPAVLLGCTFAEVKEALGFAGDAAIDAAKKAAEDPSTLFTPAGIATLIGIFVSGFATRELGTISVRGAKSGSGLLVRLIARLFKKA